MKNLDHIIQKHTFEIDCDDESLAYDLQDRTMNLMYGSLMTICEEIFDELDIPNMHLKINELVLDLGSISADLFEEQLVSRYRVVLKDAIIKLIGESKAGLHDNVDIKSEHQSVLQLFTFLSKDGFLPWWGEATWKNFASNQKLTLENLFLALWEYSKEAIIAVIQKNFTQITFQKRLIKALTNNTLVLLSTELSPGIQAFIQTSLKEIPKSFQEKFWQVLLKKILLSKESLSLTPALQDEIIQEVIALINFQNLSWSNQAGVPTPFMQRLIRLMWKEHKPLFHLPKAQYQQIIKILVPDQFSQVQVKVQHLLKFYQNLTKATPSNLKDQIWEKALHYIWYAYPQDPQLEKIIDVIQIEFNKILSLERSETDADYLWIHSESLQDFLRQNKNSIDYPVKVQFLNRVLPLYQKFINDYLEVFVQFIQDSKAQNPDQKIAQISLKEFQDTIWQEILNYLWINRLSPFKQEGFVLKITQIIFKQYPQFESSQLLVSFKNDYGIMPETSPKTSLNNILNTSENTREELLDILLEKGYLPWKDLIFLIHKYGIYQLSWLDEALERFSEFKFSTPTNIDEQVFSLFYFINRGELPKNLKISTQQFIQQIYQQYPDAIKNLIAVLDPPAKLLLKKENQEVLQQIFQELNQETQQKKLSAFKESLQKTNRRLTTQESIYVHNAGLVLLTPYIPKLFKLLEYTDSGGFRGTHEAFRAASLLQYLCAKNQSYQEFELVFNKVLCGIPLSEVLPSDIVLNEKEISTGDGMLNGVIKNWSALKSTDIDNLRVTFLLREGRLQSLEKTWHLKIEERGFDVLLDFLPWSFSMTSYAWMGKPLVTEWRES